MDLGHIRSIAFGVLELGAVVAFMGAVFVWADAVMRV